MSRCQVNTDGSGDSVPRPPDGWALYSADGRLLDFHFELAEAGVDVERNSPKGREQWQIKPVRLVVVEEKPENE